MGPRAFAHGDMILPHGYRQASRASMGPRAFAHGDHEGFAGLRELLRGFNGAAGFRPRRRPGRWRVVGG